MLSSFCLFCRAAALIKLKILTFAIQKLFLDYLFLYHFLRLSFNLFSNQFFKSNLFLKLCQRSCFHLNQETIYIKRLLQKKKSYRYGIFEPSHDKTNKMTCAPSEDSDQPGHPPSLIIHCPHEKRLGSLATHWAHSEDSDQTGQMHRLIWVFTGHSCHFVGFLMRQLICFYINEGF